MSHLWPRGRFVALLLLIGCQVALGQLTDSRMKGTVTDSSAQPVSGVSVTAANESTGETRSSLTDTHGAYVLSALSPGQYKVSVSLQGFASFERTGVQLSVGRTSQVDVQLQLGAVSERVDVQANLDQVQVSTEGRLSDSYGTKQIADLPIPQRDVFALPKLSAGATAIPGAANSTKLTNSPVITVNGNRYRGNDYVLDGSVNTKPNNTGEPAIVPNLESVEEAQVQTSNFSSEFGRGNGAVVNLRTKSGTNEFHGRLWEYLRNKQLNARNFFANDRSAQTYNQFGGNIGGPIIKNRTFFFLPYQGSQNAFAPIYTFQVETPQFRDYVLKYYPNNISASLMKRYPAPAPLAGAGRSRQVRISE